MIDSLPLQSRDDPQVTLEMGTPQAPKLMNRLRAVLEGRHFAPPGETGSYGHTGFFWPSAQERRRAAGRDLRGPDGTG